MVITYVGPKPLISHSGIGFDKNKEDKYVYLGIIITLIEALNHEYIEDKIYSCDVNGEKLDDRQLKEKLKKYCPNLDEIVNKQNHSIEEEIEHNIQRAHESYALSSEDKRVLENNIKIMRKYMLQRSVNKAVYYCAINVLATLVQKDHIDYIKVPLSQKYMHVLHSVQGILKEEKRPIDTELDVYEEKGELFAKLKVVNLV